MFTKFNLIAALSIAIVAPAFASASEADTSNKTYRKIQAQQAAEKSAPSVVVNTTPSNFERHSDTSNKGYREFQARAEAEKLSVVASPAIVNASYETISQVTKQRTSVPDNKGHHGW